MDSKKNSQQRIIKVAIKILESDGEENLRVSEVCARAKVTAPTVYHFFGDRTGLIDAAQIELFKEGQLMIGRQFVADTLASRSRDDFTKVVYFYVKATFSQTRRDIRRRRVSVLGRAQFNSSLSTLLAEFQDQSNKTIAEGLRYAQAKGWINDDVDPEMFAAWFIGLGTARTYIEFSKTQSGAAKWDEIAMKAVCSVLGLPTPNTARKKKTSNRARKSPPT